MGVVKAKDIGERGGGLQGSAPATPQCLPSAPPIPPPSPLPPIAEFLVDREGKVVKRYGRCVRCPQAGEGQLPASGMASQPHALPPQPALHPPRKNTSLILKQHPTTDQPACAPSSLLPWPALLCRHSLLHIPTDLVPMLPLARAAQPPRWPLRTTSRRCCETEPRID